MQLVYRYALARNRIGGSVPDDLSKIPAGGAVHVDSP
jgi:hypothetical protein